METPKCKIDFTSSMPDTNVIRLVGYCDKFDGKRNAVYSEDFTGVEITDEMKKIVTNKIENAILNA